MFTCFSESRIATVSVQRPTCMTMWHSGNCTQLCQSMFGSTWTCFFKENRKMLRLFCWALFIVLLLAAQAVFARDMPPMQLRQYIAQFPVVYVGECQIQKLTLPEMPCAVYFDQERDLRYVVLSADPPYVTHIYAVDKEGVPYTIWIRSDKVS